MTLQIFIEYCGRIKCQHQWSCIDICHQKFNPFTPLFHELHLKETWSSILHFSMFCTFWDILRIKSNIYDEAFSQKKLSTKGSYLLTEKRFIIDVKLIPKYNFTRVYLHISARVYQILCCTVHLEPSQISTMECFCWNS